MSAVDINICEGEEEEQLVLLYGLVSGDYWG